MRSYAKLGTYCFSVILSFIHISLRVEITKLFKHSLSTSYPNQPIVNNSYVHVDNVANNQ